MRKFTRTRIQLIVHSGIWFKRTDRRNAVQNICEESFDRNLTSKYCSTKPN